ncbi:AAA family ATPase [Bizionia argentinensis]|uniref:AAA family ATPase n=1 Tax=Bizionia argentinensis TaxID=456455 RepID=UPI0002230F34|nr:AAA family ATPase [Bizionia argentinensis]
MATHKTTIRSKNKAITLDEIHLNKDVRTKINQLLEEFTYIDALSTLQIPVDNKILLHGHTGCGKTATAHAIGLALNKKVITVNLSGFVSSRLGETGKNLAELFQKASSDNAVLFIDEFDFIGKIRDYDTQDSGEMKRLVNSLIQQIDNLADNSLLICATNHIEIIDTALLRRFQIKLNYELPTQEHLDNYYDDILSNFPDNINTVERKYGISYAEAKDVMHQQIKAQVIQYEKHKKHLVFAYNNLKSNDTQTKYYGRLLKSTHDTIIGYKLNELVPENSSKDESNQINLQQIAVKSKEKSDRIEGVVFEITGEELIQTDRYEAYNCKRVLETTQSGTDVWIYVAHNSY